MWDQRKDRKLIILSKQANNIHTDKEKVQDIFKLKYLNMKNFSINQLNIFNIKVLEESNKISVGNPDLNYEFNILSGIKK